VEVIGIRPTVDFVFKRLFGSPEHPRITIHFLNAILGPLLQIRSVEMCNPFLNKETEDDKLAILDILAKDDHGRLINIEIQLTVPAGIHQRLTYYVSSLYLGQLKEGVEYTALNPAISICVLTKPMYSRDPRLHLDFRLRDPSGLLLTNDLQIHLLQLSKLSKTVQNVAQASSIEKWAYFLVNAANLSLNGIEGLFPEAEFSEAAGVLDMISHNPEQRQLYDARLKLQLDEAARLEGALNQGREEGREEGRAEGELFGQIMLLQELLGIAELTRDELTNLSELRLSEVTEEFKRRLRNRSV
jgi:predicted transposase/invertase (TIGR01784 family)